MNCSLELNSLSTLRQKGIVDDNNILSPQNIEKFNQENLRQRDAAKQHLGYTGFEFPFNYKKTVFEGQPVLQVSANSSFFDAVDSIDTEDQSYERKIDLKVQELFESNPELANQVYEALEYAFTGQVSPAFLYESDIKTPDGKDYLSYAVKIDEQGNKYIANLRKGKQSTDKNIGKLAYYKFIIENKGVGISVDKELSLAGIKVLEQLEKEGYVKKTNAKVINSKRSSNGYDVDVYDKPLYTFTGKIPSDYLTSQQKQQALQLYSQYLDTIFPDSKVKDIVYHGTKSNEVRTIFDKESIQKTGVGLGKGFFFAGDKSYSQRDVYGYKTIGSYLLNLKNPIFGYPTTFIEDNRINDVPKKYLQEYSDEKELRNLENFEKTELMQLLGYDGVVYKQGEYANENVVFEPEQIHILGNKQDIEGFKKFVDKKAKETLLQVETPNRPRQTPASDIALNKVKELLARLGIQVSPDFTLENTGINGLAEVLTDISNMVYGSVRYAPSKESVALVEEAFHIIESILPQDLRDQLAEEVTKYKIYKETLEVYKNIPEYQLPDGSPNIPKIKREAVGKLLAEYYIGLYDKTDIQNKRLGNIFERVWQWLKSLVSQDIFEQTVRDIAAENFNYNAMTLQEDLYQADPSYVANAQRTFTREMSEKLRQITLQIQPLLRKLNYSVEKVGKGTEYLKTINESINEGHLQGLTDLLTNVLNYFDDLETFTDEFLKYSKTIMDPYVKGGKLDISSVPFDRKMDLVRTFYQINNMVDHFESIIADYDTVLQTSYLASDDWLRTTIENIKKNLNSIKEEQSRGNQAKIVASVLAENSKEAMTKIATEYNNQIKWIDSELDNLEIIANTRPLSKKEEGVRLFLENLKKKKMDKRNANLPTEENLLKILQNPQDRRSGLYAWLQFAMRTDEFQNEMLAGAVSTLIKDGLRTAAAERQNIASEMGEILEELVAVRGFSEDADVQYQGFFRTVTVKRFVEKIVQDSNNKTKHVGELIEYPAKVLNGDFDNIRFNNDIETIKYKIFEESNKELVDFDLVEDLKAQLESLLAISERIYTPEFYAIMNLLTEDDRKIIETLYQERNLLEGFGNYDSITEENLMRIEEIDREIARLSSTYDVNGVAYAEGTPEYEQAMRFKLYREAVQQNELYIYETSEAALESFRARKRVVDNKYKEAKDKFSIKQISVDEYDAAVKARDDWYYFNTRAAISQDFYIMRQEIFDDIDALLAPYIGDTKETIGELYAQLFNMTRGFRNPDGIYLGDQMTPELRARVKEIQEEINSLRELPQLPEDVQEEVSELFDELGSIQQSRNTQYWDQVVEEKIDQRVNELEAQFLANFKGTQDEIDKQVGRRRLMFSRQAEAEFKESQWYLDNTLEVTYTNQRGEEKSKRVPIMVWRETRPVDPQYISIEPSKSYSQRKVNSAYLNPNYNSSIPYKTTTNPLYANTDVDYQRVRNNPVEYDILQRYRKTYFNYQEENPYSGRLGEVLPFIHKSGMDVTVETAKAVGSLLFGNVERAKNMTAKKRDAFKKLLNPILIYWRRNISMADDDMEIEGSVRERDYKDRDQSHYKQSVYIPYITPFKYASEISSDITESIAAYGMEAIKTQTLLQMNPIAATVGELITNPLEQVKSKNRARRITRTIEHTYRKEFLSERTIYSKADFGEGRFGKALADIWGKFQRFIVSRMAFVRRTTMAFNLSSEVANAANNIYQIMVNNGIYGVSEKQIIKSAALAGRKMIMDQGDILSTGRNKEVMRAYRFFGSGGQIEDTEKLAGTIRASFWRKWANTDVIYRSRELAEVHFGITMMYSIGKTVLVELNGRYVPIYEAYEIRDNRYVPKQGAIIPEEVLKNFRRNLNKMSVDLRGAYGSNAPHAGKFILGKMFLFFKGFFVPQLMRRWVTDVNYGTGSINYGTSSKVYEEMANMIKYRKFAEYKMTDQEKRAFRTGLKEHAWYAFHTILLSTYFAMRGSGDDEEGVWAYLLYMWKRIYSETETYSPVSPVNYVLARIHEPQRSGSSSTKNSFTDATINFFFKMVDDNIVSPITGRHGGEAMGLMIDVPDWFDPYYGKFYKRGHGPDSRSPRVDRERAKTLMPHLAGKPNLIVGLLKFFNQSQSVMFYPKQAENYQSLYNYNIYMLPGEPLFIKKKKAK